MVRQESYQWEEQKFYNFVGVEYKIKNDGVESIEDLYIGFFADGDAGPRTREQYWLDDGNGLYEGIVCAQKGDRIGSDPGQHRLLLRHRRRRGTDPGLFRDPLPRSRYGSSRRETAPKKVGITSYQNFSGDQPYENGGDPTTISSATSS